MTVDGAQRGGGGAAKDMKRVAPFSVLWVLGEDDTGAVRSVEITLLPYEGAVSVPDNSAVAQEGT